MTIMEVLPTLKSLNRKDKIRAIQFLANEVAKDEENSFEEVKGLGSLALHDSFEAAEQLQKLIDDRKNSKL